MPAMPLAMNSSADVDHDHVEAGLGADLGDAGAHLTGAGDQHLLDLHVCLLGDLAHARPAAAAAVVRGWETALARGLPGRLEPMLL